MSNWAIAVLPLVGVVIGAVLQFYLSRTTERENRVELLQAEAYSDYLRAVSAAAHARSDDDVAAARRAAADAKAQIAVYGSASVVGALAGFENAGAAIVNESSRSAFTSLVLAMRPAKSRVAEEDIRLVLMGYDNR